MESSKLSESLPAYGGMRTNLRSYLVWRIAVAVLLVFLVLTMDFVFIEVLPGDPTKVLLPRGGCPVTNITNRCGFVSTLKQEWALDRPVGDRYLVFLANIFTGNWGTSITYLPGTRAWDIMAPRLFDTFFLTGVGIFVAASIAVVAGTRMARRRDRPGDLLGSMLSLLGLAVPVPLMALSFLYLFAVGMGIFPVGGDRSQNYLTFDAWGQLGDRIAHLIGPVLLVVLAAVGPFVLAVRRAWMNDPEAPSENPRGGLDRTIVRTIPAVPLLFGWVVGSVLIIETVFNLNGLGSLVWDALHTLDVFLFSAIFLLMSLVGVGVVAFFDVLHAVLAPSTPVAPPVVVNKAIALRDLGATAKRAFLRPMGLVGLVLLGAIVFITLGAPLLGGPYPTYSPPQNVGLPNLPPSQDHLLGTDAFGRDLLALVLYGGTVPLLMAGMVFALSLAFGIGVVIASGCFGGWADRGVSVILDLILAVPWLPLVIVIGLAAPQRPFELGGALTMVAASWPMAARLLRWSASKESGGDLVSGTRPAREAGLAGVARQLWALRSLVLGYSLMAAAISVVIATGLGFLGLLSSTPDSWGEIMYTAYINADFLRGRWYAFFFPELVAGIAAYGLALLAFTMRESGVPRIRWRPFAAEAPSAPAQAPPDTPPPP